MKTSLLLALFLTEAAAAAGPPADYPLQPVPFTAVRVADGFWLPRIETNRKTTVWYDFKQCEDTGRIDNFAKAGGLMPGEFRGVPWDDSDVYKIIEGAAYTLATQPDPKLDKYLDELIAKIAAAQEPDGYLYTARRLFPPDKMPGMSGRTRWSNPGSSCELYNVGHLYEAAVAHFQATGKRSLLDVALRNADLLCVTFGPGKVQVPPDHQGIEIGLARLYRATGKEQYLKLAKYLLDIRGRAETHALYGAQQQDHLPVLEQTEAVGHAVRAGYMYAGMADVAALTGDEAYVRAIDRLWEDVVFHKLHLTGGIGAGHGVEAFGGPYDLPNGDAYLETCAAIANALWNQRMFQLHGEGKYVDVLERVIYNGFLAGVSLSGDRFFYPNPLESDGGWGFNHGRAERAPWFDCSCCPVNVVRFIPSLAGFIHATRGDELYVNLFIGGEARTRVGGTDVVIKQQTRYPWDGRVTLKLEPTTAREFSLLVRIPGWARDEPVPGDLYCYDDGVKPQVALAVNGQAVDPAPVNGYARIKRTWHAGDTVTLDLEMPVRRVRAHAMVKADRDRFAVERGPLVYCAEGVDNGGKVLERMFPGPVGFTTEERPELLGGVTVIRMTPANGDAPLTLVPYHLWCHRGQNQMRVWFPFRPEIKRASHCWPSDNEDGCFDGADPKNSADLSVPRLTWWDHRGTAEWVVKRFERPTRVSGVAVYWFDDTGTGGCRVPAHWKLLYRDGEEWKPVAATGDYGVACDQYNKVTFAPVTTDALRVETQLQPGFSGGVLEWKSDE